MNNNYSYRLSKCKLLYNVCSNDYWVCIAVGIGTADSGGLTNGLTACESNLVISFSVIILAYINLLVNSFEQPNVSTDLNVNERIDFFSSIYVTACIKGHTITLVWSWKKLICRMKVDLLYHSM